MDKNLRIALPENVNRIIGKLRAAGYEAFAVGGCVRDSVIGRIPEDWDITTNATPLEVKSLFRRTLDTGIKHGTVTIMIGKEGYEVTTYRIDGEYEDGRHPKDVIFTASLEEDLKRRDFTINAMAYSDETGIIDEFNGLDDIDNHVIRAVGNAYDRFTEDALRILRALRFSAQLNYSVEEDTLKAIGTLHETLNRISAERIYAEFTKLIISEHPDRLKIADELGVMRIIMPEYAGAKSEAKSLIEGNLLAAVTCEKDEGWREFDELPLSEKDRIKLRYALLFRCFGEATATDILRRLKSDNETIDDVSRLVRYCDKVMKTDEISVRRDLAEIGTDIIKLLLIMRDCVLPDKEVLRKYTETVLMVLRRGDCVCLKDLKISGRDLIDLGVKPGIRMGEILGELLNKVIDEREANTREILIELAKEYL